MSSRRSVRRILLTLCLAPAALRAQDVAAYERRVERAADVVSDPHPQDVEPAGRRVDVDFDNRGAVGVRWGRPDAAPLEPRGGLRRGVRAGGAWWNGTHGI